MYVPGGTFEMGDIFGDGRSDEKPVHTVHLDDFWMGRYPVTVGQWRRFITDTGYFGGAFADDMASPKFKQTDDHPVVCVSWDDAEAFAKWLSSKNGARYRLPTEAEWEYAARSGGRKEKYAGGNDLDALGWYSNNSGGSTQPVGRKAANGLGLHDMSGNVWEWCGDWFDDEYYAASPEHNPPGPASGSNRVLRGGGWGSTADICRAACRNRIIPAYRFADFGFRLVCLPGQG